MRTPNRIASCLARFRREANGSIAVLYAASAVLILGFLALAVDGTQRAVVTDALDTDDVWCASALALTEALPAIDRLTDEAVLRADLEDSIRLTATVVELNAALADNPEDAPARIALFELLAGRRPFPEQRTMRQLLMSKRVEPPALHTLRPEVSERLEDICARMLAPDPDGRPPPADRR